MVNISELSAGQGNVNVQGTIKEIGETKTFNKFGRELRVANAILQDDSGSIKLTLWNDDINKFNDGDVVKIENGYVNEFQGEKQLTSGKFGKIEKVEGGESTGSEDTPEEKADVETPEPEKSEDKESEEVKVDESEVATSDSTPDEKPTEEVEDY